MSDFDPCNECGDEGVTECNDCELPLCVEHVRGEGLCVKCYRRKFGDDDDDA